MGISAILFREGATSPEGATTGRIEWRRDFSLQDNAFIFPYDIGIRDRNRRKQGNGVGMKRVLEEFLRGSKLYHMAEVHDGNAVRDVFDDQEVVSDKQVGKVQFFL